MIMLDGDGNIEHYEPNPRKAPVSSKPDTPSETVTQTGELDIDDRVWIAAVFYGFYMGPLELENARRYRGGPNRGQAMDELVRVLNELNVPTREEALTEKQFAWLKDMVKARLIMNDGQPPVERKAVLPAELFPLIRQVPLGSTIALFPCLSKVDDEKYINRYRNAVMQALPDAYFVEIDATDTSVDRMSALRAELREKRTVARDQGAIQFFYDHGRADSMARVIIEQEVDYSIRLHSGWVGLLVELGKCRQASHVHRTHALIYTG